MQFVPVLSRPPSSDGWVEQSDAPSGSSRSPLPLLPAAKTTVSPASFIAFEATLSGCVPS
jgi:hypothetical protein